MLFDYILISLHSVNAFYKEGHTAVLQLHLGLAAPTWQSPMCSFTNVLQVMTQLLLQKTREPIYYPITVIIAVTV